MTAYSPDLPELLTRIRAGDEDALVALHARYATLVYSVAYRTLNDLMAAEEVTQDTFMRVWNKAETYDPARGAFVSWLLSIARHLAIDTFRRQRRDPILDPVFVDDDLDGWDGLLPVQDDDLRHALRAALATLPDEQRQVLELAYFYGLSHSQIAEMLGQPVGTVKTRIRLGMQKLRDAWLSEPESNPNRDN